MLLHTCVSEEDLLFMIMRVNESSLTVSYWTNRDIMSIVEQAGNIVSVISAAIHPIPDDLRDRLARLALAGISSPQTFRAYSAAIDEFLTWAQGQPVPQLSKTLVQQYKSMLLAKDLAPATINQRLAAVRRLAVEAADNGLLDPAVSAAIVRVHGVSSHGIRLGHWLDQESAAELLAAPPHDSLRGMRDRAVLALLFGAGLRRGEVAAVMVEQLRLIEERWVIADLMGKHRRMRSVPVPAWAKDMLQRWCDIAGITAGRLFRQIDKSGRVHVAGLGSQTIYNIVRRYAAAVDPAVRPHDLRRSFARIAYEENAAIEQLAITLGHSSISTTERYVAARQNFRLAPCDVVLTGISIRPSSSDGLAIVSIRTMATEPSQQNAMNG